MKVKEENQSINVAKGEKIRRIYEISMNYSNALYVQNVAAQEVNIRL